MRQRRAQGPRWRAVGVQAPPAVPAKRRPPTSPVPQRTAPSPASSASLCGLPRERPEGRRRVAPPDFAAPRHRARRRSERTSAAAPLWRRDAISLRRWLRREPWAETAPPRAAVRRGAPAPLRVRARPHVRTRRHLRVRVRHAAPTHRPVVRRLFPKSACPPRPFPRTAPAYACSSVPVMGENSPPPMPPVGHRSSIHPLGQGAEATGSAEACATPEACGTTTTSAARSGATFLPHPRISGVAYRRRRDSVRRAATDVTTASYIEKAPHPATQIPSGRTCRTLD